jgi:hypothetical protein
MPLLDLPRSRAEIERLQSERKKHALAQARHAPVYDLAVVSALGQAPTSASRPLNPAIHRESGHAKSGSSVP